MRLDYSVPDIQFFIGSFDCTDYLDSLSLSQPIHEITQPLTWTGRFSISFNRKAIDRGLTEDEFDQTLRPLRWRPAQAQVSLRIKGYLFPALRIDRYAYDPQTSKGEGSLYQILDAVATDRPAIDPPLQIGGARATGTLAPVSVVAAVNALLNAAFYRCSVQPSKSLRDMPGLLYGEISTRNPVSDAQKLAGVYWNWLVVNNAETVQVLSGDPFNEPVLFSRSLQQIEWEPDIDHLNFAAEQVVVTGACQRPAKIPCDQNPAPPNNALDRKGRQKFQRIEERQPLSKIFGKAANGNLSPGISEIKWIFYQYPDDLNWDSQLLQFMPTELLYERDATTNSDRNGLIDQPCQTVTVYQQPAGRVFTSQSPAGNLMVAALEMQSENRKGRWVPYGVLDPKNQKNNPSLGLERYENLTTGVVYVERTEHSGVINPVTGKAGCLEPVPKKEERQPLAVVPLETVPIKGSAAVAPAGWSPIYPRVLSLEVGFLPDAGTANELARQIATREAWRRDSVKVTMPIPDEWLIAGCPPMRRCYLHDGQWQMSGAMILLQAGEAKFAFTAARINRVGIPVIKVLSPLIFRMQSQAKIESYLRPLLVSTAIAFRVTGVPDPDGGGGGGGAA